jgi:hypothetical protein
VPESVEELESMSTAELAAIVARGRARRKAREAALSDAPAVLGP